MAARSYAEAAGETLTTSTVKSSSCTVRKQSWEEEDGTATRIKQARFNVATLQQASRGGKFFGGDAKRASRLARRGGVGWQKAVHAGRRAEAGMAGSHSCLGRSWAGAHGAACPGMRAAAAVQSTPRHSKTPANRGADATAHVQKGRLLPSLPRRSSCC